MLNMDIENFLYISPLFSTFPTSSFLPLLNYKYYILQKYLTKDIQAKEHFNISQLTRPAVNNNHRETDALQGLQQISLRDPKFLIYIKGINKAKNKEKLNHKARQKQEICFLKVRTLFVCI